jgi:hypothetical protein
VPLRSALNESATHMLAETTLEPIDTAEWYSAGTHSE